jgi:spermidine/putrescine transport system substrate-binding protein
MENNLHRPLSRRRFVAASARLALLTGFGASAVQACGPAAGGARELPPVPLARPDRPVTLPDNGFTPASPDTPAEPGPLVIFTYADYLNPVTKAAFTEAYRAEIEIAAFDTEDRLLAGLASTRVRYDLVIGATTINLPRYVVGGLIQPIQHELLTNLGNVLPALRDPYYDRGARYTVPYTLYTTGVGYRRDVIDESALDAGNGWDLLWQPDLRGRTGLIDDAREVLTLGMQRQGTGDMNSPDPDVIARAEAEIKSLVAATNPRFDINAFTKLPEGTAHVNHAWSGDLLCAQWYLPEGTNADVLGFWAPPRAVVANDFMCIPAHSARPVLAHRFIDFLLEPGHALTNFEFVGYQPATASPSIDELIGHDCVPAHLRTALVTDSQMSDGYRLDALDPAVQSLWDDAYARIRAG